MVAALRCGVGRFRKGLRLQLTSLRLLKSVSHYGGEEKLGFDRDITSNPGKREAKYFALVLEGARTRFRFSMKSSSPLLIYSAISETLTRSQSI